MRKFFALGLCLLAVGCAEGSDTFTPSGGSSQGGSPPVEGGSNEGGGDPSDCGNGIANTGEECDGADLEVMACEDLGFVGGELACSESCEFDTSACVETLCDNGMLDDGEECDGTELGTSTCVTAGFAGGPISCEEETCVVDTTACKPNFEEGFEGATAAGFLVGNWFFDPSNFHTGAKAIRAGDINDSGTTAMSVSLTFEAAGTIEFWHREQTETCCDLLHFYIDGVQQSVWANDSWQLATFPVAAGSHTLEWRYTKDGSLSTGLDTVWVDDIAATGGYLN